MSNNKERILKKFYVMKNKNLLMIIILRLFQV